MVDKTPSGHTANDIREVMSRESQMATDFTGQTSAELNAAYNYYLPKGIPITPLAVEQMDEAQRLKECGLIWHEDQFSAKRWVAVPERRLDGEEPRIKVLPLFMVGPSPGMEIRAHGEIYLLPANFKGYWFDIVSPKGVRLIP